jgi:hypothetical protein
MSTVRELGRRVDARTSRYPVYAISLKKRWLVETFSHG